MTVAAQPGAASVPRPKIVAHLIYSASHMPIIPAPVARDWMDQTTDQFAYRCLPLLIANQSGWLVLNDRKFCAVWDGGETINSVVVEYPECAGDKTAFVASSHFGHGIVTLVLPYVFRTSPGFNLLVRGPANCPKDGAYALEGVVETDWAVSNFTMNWKLTRPGAVTFEELEPICMLVPQRRGEIESFDPGLCALNDDPRFAAKVRVWAESRRRFLETLSVPGSSGTWQKHYFQGTTPEGVQGEGHQTRLHLQQFSVLP
jgi:hypothetical protein